MIVSDVGLELEIPYSDSADTYTRMQEERFRDTFLRARIASSLSFSQSFFCERPRVVRAFLAH